MRRVLISVRFARRSRTGRSRLTRLRGPLLEASSRGCGRSRSDDQGSASVWSSGPRNNESRGMMLRRLFVWRLEPLRERLREIPTGLSSGGQWNDEASEEARFTRPRRGEVCPTRSESETAFCVLRADPEQLTSRLVHHLHPLSTGGPALDPANLTSLCAECHREAHGVVEDEQKSSMD